MTLHFIQGNTHEFAIESLAADDPKFARIRIWVGNTPFGDFSQYSVLPGIQHHAAYFLKRPLEMPFPPPEAQHAEGIRAWDKFLSSDEHLNSEETARAVATTVYASCLFPYIAEGFASIRIFVLGRGDDCLITAWEACSESTVQVRTSYDLVEEVLREFVAWIPSD